jgi:hypothetical protein
MSNSAIRTNGCDKLIFSNLVARLQRYPLVIVGESMKVFIRRMSKDDLEGINENHLCFTGGEHTLVKKSLIHCLGMAQRIHHDNGDWQYPRWSMCGCKILTETLSLWQ